MFVGGNLVSWRSKKQNVVTRSSAEAEYRAIAQGVCEVIWLKKLLEELRITVPKPIRLYTDSKAAIAIAHNPVQHDRTKHVEIDRHFIKEKLTSGLICMPYISTTSQVADIFTKGLRRTIQLSSKQAGYGRYLRTSLRGSVSYRIISDIGDIVNMLCRILLIRQIVYVRIVKDKYGRR